MQIRVIESFIKNLSLSKKSRSEIEIEITIINLGQNVYLLLMIFHYHFFLCHFPFLEFFISANYYIDNKKNEFLAKKKCSTTTNFLQLLNQNKRRASIISYKLDLISYSSLSLFYFISFACFILHTQYDNIYLCDSSIFCYWSHRNPLPWFLIFRKIKIIIFECVVILNLEYHHNL